MKNILLFGIRNSSMVAITGPDGNCSDLAEVILSATSKRLTWVNGFTNDASVSIEGSIDGITYAEIFVTAANATTYDITGLTGNFYYTRVRAVLGVNYSDYSNVSVNAEPLSNYDDSQTIAWYKPLDTNGVVKDGSNVESIYWDMVYGNNVLGAEQNSGVIIQYAVYKITATQANFFYTGCAVGDTFVCGTVKTCDANNKVQRYTGNHLTQPILTNRPTNRVFDGVDNFMQTAPITFAQPTFVYIVFKLLTYRYSDAIFSGGSLKGVVATENSNGNYYAYSGAEFKFIGFIRNERFGMMKMLFNGASSRSSVNNKISVTGNSGTQNLTWFTLADGYGGYSNIDVKEVILKNTTANEADITLYLNTKYPPVIDLPGNLCMIGDSTTAMYLAPHIASLIDISGIDYSVAVPGHTILQQINAYNALPTNVKTSLNYITIMIGINEIVNIGSSIESLTTNLQTLVNNVNTASSDANVILSTLIPARSAISVASYDKWILFNESIRGNGTMPITGTFVIADIANTSLNDGSDNLAAAYNFGDGIHENPTGRLLIADIWLNLFNA